ncbi:PhzF family phenazine biosynthesis protein [Curvibacter sp. APW13]|uniref:PhzF family phenazine biosynthesis protein n=1 Tax=Curvibacter sp. APW13 TaxID=3077236 RepID=UPI0028DFF493|nr:PhzF family phenazine biosynthesis protein [Curvibacter sp. APW13]MDT8993059.1 PhzF family phenazine biosynthesis protein [Curvibacter sp. APW13]
MTTKTLRKRPLSQVDVFTDTPYYGNALAVMHDGTDLSEADLQRFAAWTNLAETTFLLPPTPEGAAAGADYRVRIFTTAYEMPFAGHPTLGSCHAWLQAGGQPKAGDTIVQECAVGLVRIRRTAGQGGERLAFAAPTLSRSTPEPAVVAQLAQALGITTDQIVAAQALNNGPRHFGLLLDDPQTVLAIEPDREALRAWCQATGNTGVGFAAPYVQDSGSALIKRSNREARAFGTPSAPDSTGVDLEVRFFANDLVVNEDPITGSFNASLSQWLIADGHMPSRYTAAQGRCIGREGRVFIERDAQGQVWVGGQSVTCISGIVSA